MNVIKKSGRTVPFTLDKIETSIRNAGLDLKAQLSEHDVHMMAKDVQKRLIAMRGEDGLTSAFEIRAITVVAVKAYGYEKVARHYAQGIYE